MRQIHDTLSLTDNILDLQTILTQLHEASLTYDLKINKKKSTKSFLFSMVKFTNCNIIDLLVSMVVKTSTFL